MSDPLIGKQLGDYIIQDLLGRGGMARVYKGYDDRLQRFAAVKVINSDFSASDQAEYTERFRREARAIARLHHPNIVGVYQFGEYEGSYYMAMVFLEGQDLRQILKEYNEKKQVMPLADVLNVVQGIGSALDYAHSRGVIHRDIKPSNIMVDSDGRSILTDFGLALNTTEGTLGDTFGSAHYIAPEQAVSSANAVAQSDLYSLGVCLYEMLVGKVPFDDPSAMSVALKHLNEPPPPPHMFNPNLSPAIERVVFKILDKDPLQRYSSGAQLTQALQKAFEADPKDQTAELPAVQVDQPVVINTRDIAAKTDPERIKEISDGSKPQPVQVAAAQPSGRQQRTTPAESAVTGEEEISTFIAPIPVLETEPKPPLIADSTDASKPSISSDTSTTQGKEGNMPLRDDDNQREGEKFSTLELLGEAPPQRGKLLPVLLVVVLLLVLAGVLYATGALKGVLGGGATPTVPDNTAVIAAGTAPATQQPDLTATALAVAAKPTATNTELPATEAATSASSATATDTTTATQEAAATELATTVATTAAPTTQAATTAATGGATTAPTGAATKAATATAAATTAATVGVGNAATDVTIAYDQQQLIVVNTTADKTLNIANLVFVQHLSSGTDRRFEATRWRQPGVSITPDALIPGYCFQVYRNDLKTQPTLLKDCHRAGWFPAADPRWFWIPADNSVTSFDVFSGDTKLTTCLIAVGQCDLKLP